MNWSSRSENLRYSNAFWPASLRTTLDVSIRMSDYVSLKVFIPVRWIPVSRKRNTSLSSHRCQNLSSNFLYSDRHANNICQTLQASDVHKLWHFTKFSLPRVNEPEIDRQTSHIWIFQYPSPQFRHTNLSRCVIGTNLNPRFIRWRVVLQIRVVIPENIDRVSMKHV